MMLSLAFKHHTLCLLHGQNSAASVDKMKTFTSRESAQAHRNRHLLINSFYTEYWTCDPFSALSRIINSNTRSRQLLWSHPHQPAFCNYSLVSTRTDLTQQVLLTSGKSHLNWSKTEQNWKHICITAFQTTDTRKGKLLSPKGTILLLMSVSI